MTGYLLDTNVISELRRPRPDRNVRAFIDGQPLVTLYVSTVTLAELRFGIESQTDLPRRTALTDWLTHAVRPMFENRVLGITEDVMLRWRFLVEAGRQRGHTFSQPDLIIAATALEHGLTLVTRNVGDFAQCGARLLNPWNGE